MTSKDYIAIAAALAAARRNCPQGADRQAWYAALDDIGGKLADVLKQDNPRFDRARFAEACGGDRP